MLTEGFETCLQLSLNKAVLYRDKSYTADNDGIIYVTFDTIILYYYILHYYIYEILSNHTGSNFTLLIIFTS